MPHLSMEGWSAAEEEADDCKVYVCDADPIRYVAVYHRPQAWDRHRKSLLAAWTAAMGRLQGNNFMRKLLQQSFLDAVKDR